MANATSTTTMDVVSTLFNATLLPAQANDTRAFFGSLNETESDTFSILMLALSSRTQSKHNTPSPPSRPEHFSPVLLSTEWRPLSRLIFLTIMSVIGSVGNIFMISSVMVEDQLKKAGEFVSIRIQYIFSFLYSSSSSSLPYKKFLYISLGIIATMNAN